MNKEQRQYWLNEARYWYIAGAESSMWRCLLRWASEEDFFVPRNGKSV